MAAAAVRTLLVDIVITRFCTINGIDPAILDEVSYTKLAPLLDNSYEIGVTINKRLTKGSKYLRQNVEHWIKTDQIDIMKSVSSFPSMSLCQSIVDEYVARYVNVSTKPLQAVTFDLDRFTMARLPTYSLEIKFLCYEKWIIDELKLLLKEKCSAPLDISFISSLRHKAVIPLGVIAAPAASLITDMSQSLIFNILGKYTIENAEDITKVSDVINNI